MSLSEAERNILTAGVLAIAEEIMRANIAGSVRKIYMIQGHSFHWVYGHLHWPQLAREDDPLRLAHTCSVAEFKAYLRDYYWLHSKEGIR